MCITYTSLSASHHIKSITMMEEKQTVEWIEDIRKKPASRALGQAFA